MSFDLTQFANNLLHQTAKLQQQGMTQEKDHSAALLPADPSAAVQTEPLPNISAETLLLLDAAVERRKSLSDNGVGPLAGPWKYVHLKDAAAIACRAREANGEHRRVTNFIQIIASPGIDADKAAARIAELLNATPENAPDTPVGSGNQATNAEPADSTHRSEAQKDVSLNPSAEVTTEALPNSYSIGVTDERSAEIMDAFAELSCVMTRDDESKAITRVVAAVRTDTLDIVDDAITAKLTPALNTGTAMDMLIVVGETLRALRAIFGSGTPATPEHSDAPLRSAAPAASSDLGLHLDMIDADRLHELSEQLEGPMSAYLRDLSNRVRLEVRDVLALRAKVR